MQSVTSTVSANGTVTNMGESLSKVTAGSFAGVSHSGGTEVAGSWNYIIQDSSWKNSGAEYQNGYVDLIDNKMPKGFITAESNKGLVWDKNKQAYTYKGKAVDYSNVYVIDGKIGVFTNKEGTKVYTGTVYGKNNEILMTVKDANNNFYSYWAAEVTDPSATMATYRVEEYKKNLAVLEENDNKLSRDDIKKVTLDTSKANSATIGLLRNGDKAVDGAITVTSGGGNGGSGAAHDTFVKISNGTVNQTFATGSKVEAIVDNNGATTGIKINGEAYTIKSGSKVSVTQNAAEKTTTITVDGQATTITDTDTTYAAGNGITISGANNEISVKVKAGENNLQVTDAGLALNTALTGIQSINGTGAGSISFADGGNVKVNDVTIEKGGKITGVAAGTIAAGSTDAVNGSQLNDIKNSINTDISNKTFGLKDDKGSEVTSTLGNTVQVKGADGITSTVKDGALEIGLKLQEGSNLVVNSNGLALNTALTGIQSINGTGAGSISFADGGNVKVNDVTIEKGGKITGVAAGTIAAGSTDAVNGSQLHAVATEAGKHTTLSNGKNTTVKTVTTADGHLEYKVDVNDELKDIKSIIGAGEGAGSISFADGGIKLNNKVTINKDGKITGVAAGEVSSTSTDAVNGSQLHAVATEAGKHTTLSNGKNTTVESTVKDGQTDYKVNVAGDLTDITSVANGDSKINLNKDSIIISNGNKYFAITNSGIGMSYIGADYSAKSIMLGENGTTISGGLNVAGSKITGVAAGEADTDAVNVGQLNAAVQAGNTDTHIKAGEYGVGTDNKVNMQLVDKNGKDAGTVTITDVAKASDVGNVNDIADDLKNGGEGKTTVVEAVNNLNNKLDTKVGDLQYSKVEKGDIADCDSTTTAIGKLDQKLTDVAATAAKHTKVEGSKNITVNNTAKEGEAANYKVELNNDIDVNTVKANSVTTGQTVMDKDGLKVGDKVSVTATAVKVGDTTITDKGLEIKDGPSVTKDGINAGNKKVTGVADGDVKENSKDAINGGQLHQVKADINNRINGVENQVISNSNRINQLGSRVNKVGAGAAALAALHPMDFDPDDKLTFSAGYGNYGGENAAAIGAYYRPDEKVMFSVAGTVGNGENMVNAGVSFALDRTNHVSNSRTALAREVIDLRGQLAVMGAKMAKMEKAFGMLDETKTKLFPDVPANHWAYEYIAKLAGNGYIEGYPDGNFGGDRLMTRYEFAAMLYRAIEKGAALEEKIIKEFEPELGRIRVDRISGEDGDRDKIERVRVNDTKGERDHYGNKLAK